MVALAALLLTTAVTAPASASKRHGTQRYYSGVRWAFAPYMGAVSARLRLDSARAADWKSGGFIGQTLWLARSKTAAPFGHNKRTPYISVSFVRGYHGRNDAKIVTAQRTPGGRYFERATAGPSGFKFGEDHGVTFNCLIEKNKCDLVLNNEKYVSFDGTGAAESDSTFAGLESTSVLSSARGHVSGLGRTAFSSARGIVPIKVPLPVWSTGGFNKVSLATPLHRGPGSAKWTDKGRAFDASFGG